MHRRCSINKQQSPGCNTRLPCALLLHHHLPAQVHFPTYLALPSLPRGLLSHPMVSPLFSPTYLYPPYPLARPVSASEAQEEDGMDLGQRKVCPWGMGERSFWCVCECVCVRERGRECVCVRESLSLSLSLSLCLFLSLSVAFSCSYCALSHNAQTRTHTPTPTPNITPTLVQRAGMPRFLRKPFSGEQGTRQGSITTHPPTHIQTQKHTKTHTHTNTHTRQRSPRVH